jgi:hypothetical protein
MSNKDKEMDIIKCKCSIGFTEDEFKDHFSRCSKFKEAFKEFDTEYGKLIKKFSNPPENLSILKFLMSQYVNKLEEKIQKMLIFIIIIFLIYLFIGKEEDQIQDCKVKI